MVVGEQARGLDCQVAGPERLTVAEDFLGSGIDGFIVGGFTLVELIVSGDDVLDFGAVLGLLESEGIDENALMGMVPTAPFNSARARPADATALRMAVVSKRAGGKTLRSGSMGLRNV